MPKTFVSNMDLFSSPFLRSNKKTRGYWHNDQVPKQNSGKWILKCRLYICDKEVGFCMMFLIIIVHLVVATRLVYLICFIILFNIVFF